MVAADCRDEKRFLAVCCGHGGMGTLAATRALTSRRFGEFLDQTRDPDPADDSMPPWCLGEDRVCQLVCVDRRKPTPAPIDDLVFVEPEEEKDLEFDGAERRRARIARARSRDKKGDPTAPPSPSGPIRGDEIIENEREEREVDVDPDLREGWRFAL